MLHMSTVALLKMFCYIVIVLQGGIMTIDEVVSYYKSGYRFEKDTGISRRTLTYWKLNGSVPPLMQMKIEYITCGKLKADLTELKKEWDEYSELNKVNKV